APLSLHSSGNRYTWTHREWFDGTAELPELPQVLINHLDALKCQGVKVESAVPLEFSDPPEGFTDEHLELAALSAGDFADALGGQDIVSPVPDARSMALVKTMLAFIPKPEHHDDLVNVAFELSHYVAGTSFEDRGRELFFEWYADSPKSHGDNGASIEPEEKIEGLWQDGCAKALRGEKGLKTIGSFIKQAIGRGWTKEEA